MKRFSRSNLNNIPVIIFVLLLNFSVQLNAQDSLQYVLSARKDIYQYDWEAGFLWSKMFAGYQYNFKARLLSNYYSLSSTNGYFNDRLNLSQNLHRQLSHNWEIGFRSNYSKFNNQQVHLEIDHLQNAGFLRLNSPQFSISGELGSTYKQKYNVSHNALMAAIRGMTGHTDKLSGISLSAAYQIENFSYNNDEQFNIHLDYLSKFSKESLDSIRISYSSTNYADYFNQNLDLEKVDIEEWKINNYLIFFSNQKGSLAHVAQLRKRDFNQSRLNTNSFRKEIEILSLLRYQFRVGKLLGKLDLRNYLLNNDFNQNFLDNEHLLFDLNGHFKWNVNAAHSLELSAKYSKLEYNTPDSLINFDDRDELTGLLQLSYQYKPSQQMQYSLYFNSRYFYQKYIYKERSALNNREIILNLGFSNRFQTNYFKNFISSAIRSYYLIHDYSDRLRNLNDIVNRSLSIEDTLTLIINPWNEVTVYSRYEKEEIGALDWTAFAYSLERENSRNQFMIFWKHSIIRNLILAPGISVISRKDFIIPGTQRLIRNYKSKSYWIRLQYHLHSNKVLFFQLQRFSIQDLNFETKSYVLGSARMLWRF